MPRVSMAGLWAVVVLQVGCTTDEADFTTALAKAQCRTMERCALGRFEGQFSGLADCVDESAHDLDEWVELGFAGCAYDAREASRCIERVRGMACEDWVRGDDERACDLVYDCAE